MAARSRILFDVTRLVRRSVRSTPTGIDRVDLAYLTRFMDPQAGAAHEVDYVFNWRGRTGLIRRAAVETLYRKLQARWDAGQAGTADPVFTALAAELATPPDPSRRHILRLAGPPLSGKAGRAVSLMDVIGREARLRQWLGRNGADALYIHTSHSGLERPESLAWLDGSRTFNVFFLHDVIPVEFPEYCRPGEDDRHFVRLGSIARHAGLVLANSHATVEASRQALEGKGWRVPPFAVAPLGVEACFRDHSRLMPTGASHPYCVFVGTLEPRKNLPFLLSVWARLAERHAPATPRLVLAGRRGWEIESLADLLERSRSLAPYVVEAADLGDRGIASLVAGAHALVAPSMAEGFDLPVVEAQALGVPVIASDIPVHREVGDGRAVLVDAIDGPGWVAAVARACGLAGPVPAPGRPGAVVSWSDHVRLAFAAIDRIQDPN